MLVDLVAILKTAVRNRALGGECIEAAIDDLRELGFNTYDSVKFPSLRDTGRFTVDVGESPSTLAEALLWKLGKWPAYKKFVQSYATQDLAVSSEGGVVFSAFAKHLQDNNYPIYDQHAIRSIWAICDLSVDEINLCRSLLFHRDGSWKPAGSGDNGACYNLFVRYVSEIHEFSGVTLRELDLLLMPLGQALKVETRAKGARGSDLDRFTTLCG